MQRPRFVGLECRNPVKFGQTASTLQPGDLGPGVLWDHEISWDHGMVWAARTWEILSSQKWGILSSQMRGFSHSQKWGSSHPKSGDPFIPDLGDPLIPNMGILSYQPWGSSHPNCERTCPEAGTTARPHPAPLLPSTASQILPHP